MRLRLVAAAGVVPLVAGCLGLPDARSVTCAAAIKPEISLSPDGKTASAQLDVLTYNVEGLPRPARRGRAEFLRQIGEHLAQLRASERAPDIVMFQEVFSRSAVKAVVAAGYPSIAPGPSPFRPRRRSGGSLPGRANPAKGEIGLKFLSSGILIATEFPILEQRSMAFPRGSCAGFDCLASKGAVFTRIAVPGVPGSLDLFNTHMNSTRASRVAERRHLAAHQKQVFAMTGFMLRSADLGTPVIFGGDFNMRHSEKRFSEFSRLQPLQLVHRYCIERPGECDVRASWDGDEPWMDTQDLQLFWSGRDVEVRPLIVETMFDGGAGGPRLSDHDGFRVTYQLSWPAALTPASPCGGRSGLPFAASSPISRPGSRADGALANPVRSGRKQP